MKSSHRVKPPWPTRAPTSLIYEKQKAWCKYKTVRARLGRKTESTRLAYQSFSEVIHRVRTFVVRSQAEYEEGLIQRSRENPKVLHAYIRQKKVGRPSVGPLRLESGQLTDNTVQTCASVWQKLLLQCTPAQFLPTLPPIRSLREY